MLSEIRIKAQEIRRLEKEIERLRACAERCTGALNNIPGATGKPSDKVGDVAAKIADKTTEYADKVLELQGPVSYTHLRAHETGSLTDLEKKIITLRDVDGLRWEVIANKLNYSCSHVKRVYKKSLRKLKDDTK